MHVCIQSYNHDIEKLYCRIKLNQKKHKEVHNELFRNRKGSGQRNT